MTDIIDVCEDNVITELEKIGYYLQTSYVVGLCRYCHKELRGSHCINSKKGTSYHVYCAGVKENIIKKKES